MFCNLYNKTVKYQEFVEFFIYCNHTLVGYSIVVAQINI